MPLRLRPRSTSAQDSVDSRWPSEIETSSLVPSAAHTDDDQGTQPGLFEADVEVDAVGAQVDVVDVFEGAVGELVPLAAASRW